MYKIIKLPSLTIALLFLMTGCNGMLLKNPPFNSQRTNESLVCPSPKVIEKIIEVPVPAKTGGELNLPIIGEVEKVQISPTGTWYDARIDTGANSSSIHAENIQLVERDGEKRITFFLRNRTTNTLTKLERKLHRKVLIKQKRGKPERRYVVKLWLSLGNIKELVDVTLTDRTDFNRGGL